MMDLTKDFDVLYRIIDGRDARFDGSFYTGVTSTGVYCRPSCPAMTPKPENVRFYRTAAAAQSEGLRACKRCRPDAIPGSPEWNSRSDLASRAMKLIDDGIVDREGVSGLARRLNYTERHLNRQLVSELGAGPLALARTRRADTARLLIETTDLPITEIAFASGFTSIRQFNETVREVFASNPRDLRKTHRERDESLPGRVSLRLPHREPFDAAGVLDFLGRRAVPGVEEMDGEVYRRTLRLPNGTGVVELSAGGDGYVRCVLDLEELSDVGTAVERCRRLLDLDADPVAVAELLGSDPLLGPLVRHAPGLRAPASADGFEMAVRAIIGQQISISGARTLLGKLVRAYGEELTAPDSGLTHVFPEPDSLLEAGLDDFGLTETRKAALLALCESLRDGDLFLDPGADRDETWNSLLAIPGIGPWTASYISMRALGDPDVFLPTDLGVRHAVRRLGGPEEVGELESLAEEWRPWRSYATHHLWVSLDHEKPL